MLYSEASSALPEVVHPPFWDGGQGQLAPPCLSQPGSLGQPSQAWPLHCRSVYRPREAALSRSMELYSNAPPAALGIPPKLLPRDPEASVAGAYPYGAAAQELGLLVLECCPQKKLDCIGESGVVTSLGEGGGGGVVTIAMLLFQLATRPVCLL